MYDSAHLYLRADWTLGVMTLISLVSCRLYSHVTPMSWYNILQTGMHSQFTPACVDTSSTCHASPKHWTSNQLHLPPGKYPSPVPSSSMSRITTMISMRVQPLPKTILRSCLISLESWRSLTIWMSCINRALLSSWWMCFALLLGLACSTALVGSRELQCRPFHMPTLQW